MATIGGGASVSQHLSITVPREIEKRKHIYLQFIYKLLTFQVNHRVIFSLSPGGQLDLPVAFAVAPNALCILLNIVKLIHAWYFSGPARVGKLGPHT